MLAVSIMPECQTLLHVSDDVSIMPECQTLLHVSDDVSYDHSDRMSDSVSCIR